MEKVGFNKTIILSMLAHLMLSILLSFSFGSKLNILYYPPVSFLGKLLFDVPQFRPSISAGKDSTGPFVRELDRINYLIRRKTKIFNLDYKLDIGVTEYKKPHFNYLSKMEKAVFKDDYLDKKINDDFLSSFLTKRNQVITFYPLLPYTFPIYFSDRHLAYVELMFNCSSLGNRKFIDIKRKVSCGNLEVDLLTRRHMSHYLFLQRVRFEPDVWHTAKINLTLEDD